LKINRGKQRHHHTHQIEIERAKRIICDFIGAEGIESYKKWGKTNQSNNSRPIMCSILALIITEN